MDKLNTLWLDRYVSVADGDDYHWTSCQSAKTVQVIDRHLKESVLPFVHSDSRVLDVGCNTGYFTSRLAALSRHVVGIDYCQEFLEIAQKNYPQVTFRHGSIYDSDLPSESFDVIVCYGVLQNLEHPAEAIRNLNRMLSGQPGALLSMITRPSGSLLTGHWMNRIFTSLSGQQNALELSRFDQKFFRQLASEMNLTPKFVYRSVLMPGRSNWFATHLCVDLKRL